VGVGLSASGKNVQRGKAAHAASRARVSTVNRSAEVRAWLVTLGQPRIDQRRPPGDRWFAAVNLQAQEQDKTLLKSASVSAPCLLRAERILKVNGMRQTNAPVF